MNLTLGSFNVYNLVRPGVPFYSSSSYTEEESAAKTTWLGERLGEMDADVVGFQEIFHRETLLEATDKSGLYADHDRVLAPGATREDNEVDGRAQGPKVGLASRLPLIEHQSITLFPDEARLRVPEGLEADSPIVDIGLTRFERPVLKARVELPTGQVMVVFVAHLKSKRPIVFTDLEDKNDPKIKALGAARSLIKRAAEATALRCLLVDELKESPAPTVLIGDLNDSVASVTTQICAGDPPWIKLSTAQKRPIWDVLLYSTNDIQSRNSLRDVTYSHIFNSRYEVLDHIFVSQEFYSRNPERIGRVSYQHQFNDHLWDETLIRRPKDRTISDHGQVVATIRLEED